ncbi:unnamed protein product [Cylindrotheca closterium]|uniref:Uncharacterized protein n=1 Tax=Cylindrotheca closterium TaxID=2856 RepID=A0AAD2FXZ0_9STRA|nr:unnamed protein product [Cylindrotheca closterium]
MGGSQQVPKDTVRAHIHPTVKKIEPNAFSDCKELRFVEFSDGLEVIGHRAFYRCAQLAFVRLSSTTKKIETGAFRSCKKLKHVLFNDGLEELGTSAFAECKALQYLAFSSTIQLVGQGAFLGCSGLEKVAFNLGLEKVESGAFSNCRKLKFVYMPSEVCFLLSDAVPDEVIIENTRNEKFWTKVAVAAEEVEADLVEQYRTVESSEGGPPENDTSDLVHASELAEARKEIDMLKGLLNDMKRKAKTTEEDLESAAKDKDSLVEEIKKGRVQLEGALSLAEELQEELTFVDEQRQATQELLEKALDQRDELAEAKNMLELDQPNMVDVKDFEEHIDFIEAQAEETRKEFEKTARECAILQKENTALKKKNKQLEQVMQLRNKEYMDLLSRHVEAKLNSMEAAPEQVLAAVQSPKTPSKKKKAVNAVKSSQTPSKKKKASKKKRPSLSPRATKEPSDDSVKSKKATVGIPAPELVEIVKQPSADSGKIEKATTGNSTVHITEIGKEPLDDSGKNKDSMIPLPDQMQTPSDPVGELSDGALSESEFGSEHDILDDLEPVAVISENVEPDDDWEASSHQSSCHESIDWLGKSHGVIISADGADDSGGNDLFGQ